MEELVMPESELEREEHANRARERSHGTKRLLMGAFLAVLIAGGAYVMFSSSSSTEQVAQQDVTAPAMPTFAPPTSPPPIPLPDAMPKPKADLEHPAPVTPDPVQALPTPPVTPQ